MPLSITAQPFSLQLRPAQQKRGQRWRQLVQQRQIKGTTCHSHQLRSVLISFTSPSSLPVNALQQLQHKCLSLWSTGAAWALNTQGCSLYLFLPVESKQCHQKKTNKKNNGILVPVYIFEKPWTRSQHSVLRNEKDVGQEVWWEAYCKDTSKGELHVLSKKGFILFFFM